MVIAISGTLFSQGVAINTAGANPHDAAILDVSATNKGVLIPRLTTTERDKITSDAGVIGYTGYDPEESLLIYNTDRCCFEFYANGSWHGMGCIECGEDVTFTYRGSTVTYGTVESNCKCWLDRNLGSSQVATSTTDAASYGDLFQWGRLDDGHQVRSPAPGTTTTLSGSDTPGHANFITNSSSPTDWRSPQNDNLWQGVLGTNNSCPSGWRLPTEAELNNERLSWSSNNAAGAFASPLKLPMAGCRHTNNGSLLDVGTGGYYWTGAVSGTNSYRLHFDSSSTSMTVSSRGHGFSVRCIKN